MGHIDTYMAMAEQMGGGDSKDERRHEWKFFTRSNGHWIWRQIPPRGRAVSSEQSFATLTDCIADARRNGYVLWTSRERRRDPPV